MLLGKLTPKFVCFCGALAIVCGLLLALIPLAARANVPDTVQQAATISDISGTVRNQAGTGLASIQVTIYRQQPDGSWGEVRSVYSDNSGVYTTGPLETGLYRLRFLDSAGVYAFEYYGDQTTLSAASDIPVVGASVQNEDVVMVAGGAIKGNVQMYDGQVELSFTVNVYQLDGTGWQYLFWRSFPVMDPFNPVSYGSYTIGGLAAGTYRLAINAYYQGSNYTEYYLNGSDLPGATNIVVAAGSTTTNSDVILGDEKSRISGRVTAQNGSPLPNIQVTAYVRSTMMGSENWMEVRSTSTDTSGKYSMPALDAGTYFLRFLDQSGVYAFEYYNNANSLATATPAVVPQDTAVTNEDVVMAAGGAISGNVQMYDGQTELSFMVNVYQLDGTGWQYLFWRSFPVMNPPNPVSYGTYMIGGLAAGTYRLAINAYYQGSNYTEYYLNGSDLPGATNIVVAAGSTTTNSDVILGDEKSRISGRVTAQNGSPLPNIQVTAYVRSTMMGSENWMEVRSTSTDTSGKYSMPALDAGTYFLRFLDQSGVYAFEYYNNANSLATATPVVVPQDTAVSNEDVVMVAGGAIKGNVQMYDGQVELSFTVNVYQLDGTGWQYLFWRSFPVMDPFNPVSYGSYTIGGLAAGTYRLAINAYYQGSNYTEYYLNGSDLPGATNIVVTAGSTTNNSDVILGDSVFTGRISGLVINSAGPLPGIRVELYQDSGGWNGWWRLVYTLTGTDGRYTIGGLRDGSYRVRFVDPNGVLASLYYDGKPDFVGAKTIIITGQNQVANVDGSLAGAGAIAGQVSLQGGGAASGFEVMAYRAAGSGWEALGRATTDAVGKYRINGLPAGAYRVYFAGRAGTYRPVYYNNAVVIEGGADVNVAAEATRQGIDAVLEPPAPPAIAVSSPGANIMSDPVTGQVAILTTSGARADTTITRAVACASGVPSGVQLLFNNVSYAMSPASPGFYQATIPAGSIVSGDLVVAWQCSTVPQQLLVGHITLYDPSGKIVDQVTGQPIVNASVTLYRVPNWLPDTDMQQRNCRTITTRGGVDWSALPPADAGAGVMMNPALDAASMDPAVNPQVTNAEGGYGWNVAQGCYYVAVSAPGYDTKFSPIVGVPPAVTDLNLALAPNSALTAVDDTAVVVAGVAQSIAVLANDSGAAAGSVLVQIVTPPAHGTATVGADGAITYAADAAYTGTDQFAYSISNAAGLSSTAAVLLAVTAPGAAAALIVPDTPVDLPTGATSFILPVNLNPTAGSLSSTAFSLDYDTACLSINPADSNGDGIPEAISGLPDGFVNSVMLDTADTDGELDVAMWDVTPPLAALPAGALLKIKFDILPACQGPADETTYVRFSTAPSATFSDGFGNAVYRATQGADPLLLDYNQPPTAINLSPSSVAENMPTGTTVGTLSVSDPDGDTPVYTLSAACGSGAFANGDFSLSGITLKTAGVFDFEDMPSKTICVEANDGQGGTFAAALAISILDVNEPPTGIALSNNTVWEGAAIGTAVGSFSTSGDPDAVQTFSYSLVSGDGAADNSKFTIDGSQLKTAAVLDYAAQPVLYIRVRSTDGGGLFVDKQFVIHMLDHSLLSIGDDFVVRHNETVPIPVIFTGNGNAPTDAAFKVSYDAACLTYVSTSGATGSITGVGVVKVDASGSPIATGTLATINFTANLACPSGTSVPLVFTAAGLAGPNGPLPVETDDGKVLVIANSARGDCNSDGFVNAGDFSAIVLETFDTDLPWWLDAPGSTFHGSPAGCDANASNYIDVADVVCTVLVVFGNSSCTGGSLVAAAAAEPAVLAVAPAADGSGIAVPVTLDRKGATVAAAAFTLTYDPQQVTFDSTDADGDGLPDAVVFATTSDLKRSVSVDASAGRIKVAVYGLTLPLPTIDDGLVATIHLQALGDQPLTGFSLVDPALGSDTGSNTPVEVAVGGVQVKPFIYLPAVLH